MLTITIPDRRYFDEDKEEFVTIRGKEITMEHSLLAIRKWEAKWHKAYLGKQQKTFEETIDYFRFMTITKNVDPMVYYNLSEENVKQLSEYMRDPMSATTFSKLLKRHRKNTNEIVTCEVVYSWMIANDIPFECERWHFNQLMTLINVCATKQMPVKKMEKKDIFKEYAALNAKNRAKYNSKG